MDVGYHVRFLSQPYPFLVTAKPCLKLQCQCTEATLTFREIFPVESARNNPLTFHVRLCLKHWREIDPPPRTLEVEALAREFLATFPDGDIEQLLQEFRRERAVKQSRLMTRFSGDSNRLVSYGEILTDDEDPVARMQAASHFFVFEGREFWVEDWYCPAPHCDCRLVHLDFWERLRAHEPEPHIALKRSTRASYHLDGRLSSIEATDQSEETTDRMLAVWQKFFPLYAPRYEVRYSEVKLVGARSFPVSSRPQIHEPVQPLVAEVRSDVRLHLAEGPAATANRGPQRNKPCPCGSGRKYKRCCGRPAAAGR